MEDYRDKCRFCIEAPRAGETFTNWSQEAGDLFSILTAIDLTQSNQLSTSICKNCDTEFERISQFKENLIKKQKFLKSLFDESHSSNQQETHNKKSIKLKTSSYDSNKISQHDTDQLPHHSKVNCSDVLPSDERSSRRKKKKEANPLDEYPDKTCPICAKIFTEKRKIPLHIKRIHVKIKDFNCDQCEYSAYTQFDIARHVRNIHTLIKNEGDKRCCPHCGKVVKGNNQLTLHIRKKHLNIKKYQCDLCTFASYGKYEIRSHLEHIHIPKEFKESHPCQLCPSILSSAMGLKVHLQHKHSGLKPHSCFCGKSFSLRETLKTHIRNVHKGERRFACQFCPKRFGQAIRLRDHESNHHGTKQEIPCTLCSKVFHSNRNLKAHLVYHDEPKFNCDCGKKFYLSNKLKEHSKTHEGAEHSCAVCSRSFQLLSSLKRHLKNHQQIQ